MSCVPLESRKFEPGPQEHLNQLLTLISTLRGGESRYLPLVMAKIRDTLPAIGTAIPQGLNYMGVAGSPQHNNNGMVGRMDMGAQTTPPLQQRVKQESSGSEGAGTPYETPPFMHFYPLA